jgi:hypothetical protein
MSKADKTTVTPATSAFAKKEDNVFTQDTPTVNEPVIEEGNTSGIVPIPVDEEIVEEPPQEPMYNPNDGLHGRTGGPYLDELELREGEIRRATAEGREPDFNNMSSVAGVRLVTAGQLASANVVTTVAVPSESNVDAVEEMIQVLAHNPNVGPNPVWVPDGAVVEDVPTPTLKENVTNPVFKEQDVLNPTLKQDVRNPRNEEEVN